MQEKLQKIYTIEVGLLSFLSPYKDQAQLYGLLIKQANSVIDYLGRKKPNKCSFSKQIIETVNAQIETIRTIQRLSTNLDPIGKRFLENLLNFENKLSDALSSKVHKKSFAKHSIPADEASATDSPEEIVNITGTLLLLLSDVRDKSSSDFLRAECNIRIDDLLSVIGVPSEQSVTATNDESAPEYSSGLNKFTQ